MGEAAIPTANDVLDIIKLLCPDVETAKSESVDNESNYRTPLSLAVQKCMHSSVLDYLLELYPDALILNVSARSRACWCDFDHRPKLT